MSLFWSKTPRTGRDLMRWASCCFPSPTDDPHQFCTFFFPTITLYAVSIPPGPSASAAPPLSAGNDCRMMYRVIHFLRRSDSSHTVTSPRGNLIVRSILLALACFPVRLRFRWRSQPFFSRLDSSIPLFLSLLGESCYKVEFLFPIRLHTC